MNAGDAHLADEQILLRGCLDPTSLSEFREQIATFEATPTTFPLRTYPGYPRWPLPMPRRRPWRSLEAALTARRSERALSGTLPRRPVLGRLLHFAHGVTHATDRGPSPSSGGLQSLELYVVTFAPSWLPPGRYHYDRTGQHLSQLGVEGAAARDRWRALIPSMHQFTGGALLWILVGDQARLGTKYGDRSHRFLLLEAGHLMQNLCLVSASLGLCTLPLGGFLERDIARTLDLLPSDLVLYVGACGRPTR